MEAPFTSPGAGGTLRATRRRRAPVRVEGGGVAGEPRPAEDGERGYPGGTAFSWTTGVGDGRRGGAATSTTAGVGDGSGAVTSKRQRRPSLRRRRRNRERKSPGIVVLSHHLPVVFPVDLVLFRRVRRRVLHEGVEQNGGRMPQVIFFLPIFLVFQSLLFFPAWFFFERWRRTHGRPCYPFLPVRSVASVLITC